MGDLDLKLTKRESEAVLRAHLSVGYGVRRSKYLVSAEEKLKAACRVVVEPHPTQRGGE